MMQKKWRISAGLRDFLVASVGCHFAKVLLVQAIDTRCCGYDDESVWGGMLFLGK